MPSNGINQANVSFLYFSLCVFPTCRTTNDDRIKAEWQDLLLDEAADLPISLFPSLTDNAAKDCSKIVMPGRLAHGQW